MESGSSEMQEFIEEFITRKTDEEEEALPNQMSIFDLEVDNAVHILIFGIIVFFNRVERKLPIWKTTN